MEGVLDPARWVSLLSFLHQGNWELLKKKGRMRGFEESW
jgi:hypothetical protein